MNRVFAAIITEEDDMFVASSPETGVTSQGKSLEEALANLREALELYLEEVGGAAGSDLSTTNHAFLTTVTV